MTAFTRTKEDFTCEQCGREVQGDGYTNHCPNCLWSKHVDVEPGDRASGCGGTMKPIAVEGTSPEYDLLHECVLCGHRKRNKASLEDSKEALALVASQRL